MISKSRLQATSPSLTPPSWRCFRLGWIFFVAVLIRPVKTFTRVTSSRVRTTHRRPLWKTENPFSTPCQSQFRSDGKKALGVNDESSDNKIIVSGNSEPHSNDSTNINSRKMIGRRVGGRADRPSFWRKKPSKSSKLTGKITSKLEKLTGKSASKIRKGTFWVILTLTLSILLKSFFASQTNHSAGYIYYQSSVYESRMIGADGKVETIRKESVRSNIPSLMEKKSLYGSSSLPPDSSVDIPNSKFNNEIESLMNIQDSILKDLN
jgi:hypothetical protein